MKTSPILVTGGTGTLGRHVVPLLRAAGREVRVLNRSGGTSGDGVEYVAVDLLKGEGVEPALAGVETVVHLAGGNKGDDTVARNLVRAAQRAGVRHLVHISVIGADTMPLGWFRTQLAAERAITDSGIPWTMLRAAQFHDLVLTMAEKMAKMPVVPVPGGLRFQPVDSREVAARLAELALGQPAGLVAPLAGPTVYPLGDLLRDYLEARGKRRPLLPIRMPGKAGRAYRAGENLALRGNDVGKLTWETFLAERVG
ncbi:SDR family oxidoreductase [Streptomyces sp. NPDC005551]|uniref:SDR family oxidoreductase n=1 Tax=unclassified Streptomyces TaxID=2593676 RepID=UPI0033D4BEAF